MSGSTIDYGPFSWVEAFDRNFCSWISDNDKQFAFWAQPDVGGTNIRSLVDALAPLIDHVSHGELVAEIETMYAGAVLHYKNKFFALKLGLVGWGEEANQLLEELLLLMESSSADYTITFRQLAAVVQARSAGSEWSELLSLLHRHPGHNGGMTEEAAAPWTQWLDRWLNLLQLEDRDPAVVASVIRASSPKYPP